MTESLISRRNERNGRGRGRGRSKNEGREKEKQRPQSDNNVFCLIINKPIGASPRRYYEDGISTNGII